MYTEKIHWNETKWRKWENTLYVLLFLLTLQFWMQYSAIFINVLFNHSSNKISRNFFSYRMCHRKKMWWSWNFMMSNEILYAIKNIILLNRLSWFGTRHYLYLLILTSYPELKSYSIPDITCIWMQAYTVVHLYIHVICLSIFFYSFLYTLG